MKKFLLYSRLLADRERFPKLLHKSLLVFGQLWEALLKKRYIVQLGVYNVRIYQFVVKLGIVSKDSFREWIKFIGRFLGSSFVSKQHIVLPGKQKKLCNQTCRSERCSLSKKLLNSKEGRAPQWPA